MLYLDITLEMIIDQLSEDDLLVDIYQLENGSYGIVLLGEDILIKRVIALDKHYISLINMLDSYKDKNHLYICPDGALYNVSFERYIDGFEISYLSSPKSLLRKKDQRLNNEDIVSFVCPDFNDDYNDDQRSGVGILYGSYLEGKFMNDIYKENCHLYSYKEANHDNFINIRNPKVLHVSTHGQYIEDETYELMDRGRLLLAGYNIENKNDGYVTAGEIQDMNLNDTDLVVLSACNTGIGESVSGEGIYGIRRAFELAGAKTLLLTVEEIDDLNSAIFMNVFYQFYNKRKQIYESFKEAREYLKDIKNSMKELKGYKEKFKQEMEGKIGTRSKKNYLKEIDQRIRESENRGYIVKKKGREYIKEDWKGFIIQGRIDI